MGERERMIRAGGKVARERERKKKETKESEKRGKEKTMRNIVRTL